MYQLKNGALVFTSEVILEDEDGIRLETANAQNTVYTYPATGVLPTAPVSADILGVYIYETAEKTIAVTYERVAANRYTIRIPSDCVEGVKDALLQIDYQGDIGHAFIDGAMISDNFCNGATWEIGLKDFEEQLKDQCLTIYITPLKEGANVNVESAMAARKEEITSSIGEISNVRVCPVYEIKL